jgi:hypothetical protein
MGGTGMCARRKRGIRRGPHVGVLGKWTEEEAS